MKPNSIPSWRRSDDVIAIYRALAEAEAARPKLNDVLTLAKARHDKAAAAAKFTATKALIGRVSDRDATKASNEAQDALVALAQAEHDVETNEARIAALRDELPAIEKQAKTIVGREVIALVEETVREVLDAGERFIAARKKLTAIGDQIETDYSGPAIMSGDRAVYRLIDFPSKPTQSAPFPAIYNALRGQLHEHKVAEFRKIARDNGLNT
jgi:hypothetical protein